MGQEEGPGMPAGFGGPTWKKGAVESSLGWGSAPGTASIGSSLYNAPLPKTEASPPSVTPAGNSQGA